MLLISIRQKTDWTGAKISQFNLFVSLTNGVHKYFTVKNTFCRSRHHCYLEFVWMPTFCNDLAQYLWLFVFPLFFFGHSVPPRCPRPPGLRVPRPGRVTRDTVPAWHGHQLSRVMILQRHNYKHHWPRSRASDWSLGGDNHLLLVAMLRSME